MSPYMRFINFYGKLKDCDYKTWLMLSLGYINIKDIDRTLLMHASVYGSTKIVKLLLLSGADIETNNEYVKTPLILASQHGHIEIVKLLLLNGANIEAIGGEFGRTPLMWACEYGKLKIAKLLLNCGANINVIDKNGNTALDYALNKNMTKLLKLYGAK